MIFINKQLSALNPIYVKLGKKTILNSWHFVMKFIFKSRKSAEGLKRNVGYSNHIFKMADTDNFPGNY